ncbi:hypothetical protein V6N13_120699 [Hibiscus sabdariffa]
MEFVEYLNHVGLGHIPRLTHVEWGVIVSSFGKPQREVLPTDLSLELVTDIDCMPLNPLENLAETLRRQNLAVDDFPVIPESQVNGHSDFCGPRVYTPSGYLENATSPANMLVNPIKEAILMELKNTNDNKLENRNGGGFLKGSEPFKNHIAMVSSALHNLRQHNAYPTSQISPQQKPPTNSHFIGGLASSLVSQESDSVAGEIVESSRLKVGFIPLLGP